jgi:glycosyltransferase involved in cell wall biosynthesis
LSSLNRILYVDEISKIAGGANSFLTLFRNIDRGKYELLLICPEGPLAEEARDLGVRTFDYTFKYPRFKVNFLGKRVLNPLPLFVRFGDALWLARIAREFDVSLIHTNNLNSHLAGLFASKLTGVPLVWHIRTLWPSILYKSILPGKMIFVSKAVMDKAFGPEENPRAVVIHNGIELDSFKRCPDAYAGVRKEFGLQPDEKIVGIVGRLGSTWKGHRYFLEAARRMMDRGLKARFMIVGEKIMPLGQTRQELVDLTHHLGLDDAVIFTGFRNDVARLMSAFDVFVSASRNDPNPRVVLEAMAVGLPIVGTTSGGVPEMIEDGASGVLVEPENSEALASAIAWLLSEPGLAKRLANAARERVSTLFEASIHAGNVERVYRELLAEGAD